MAGQGTLAGGLTAARLSPLDLLLETKAKTGHHTGLPVRGTHTCCQHRVFHTKRKQLKVKSRARP